ncbi:MAG TPA: hypothetical protein DCE55_00055 [Planctomycetaceae bacterium]|nr:hypothetical protein [Planctomycetaceae bacterium]
MKKLIKRTGAAFRNRIRSWADRLTSVNKTQAEVDALYRFMHKYIHDNECAPDLAAAQTASAFGFQWASLQDGEYMTRDPWFQSNVTRILCEQELMLPAAWFPGKHVLDCGCGGGRWSYGLAKLGANVTAVDINQSCLDATRDATAPFPVEKSFVRSPLEDLGKNLPHGDGYDLVFSWGVLHHCKSFNESLRQIASFVKEGGIIYLFLYGHEPPGYGHENEFEIFKKRIYYNALPDWEAQEAYLERLTGGDRDKMNKKHDKMAPLLNRRHKFRDVASFLEQLGFTDVQLTKQMPSTWEETFRTGATHQLFVRAVRGDATAVRNVSLPQADPPYWIWKYRCPQFGDRVVEKSDAWQQPLAEIAATADV